MAGRAHRRGWGHLRKLPSTKWQATYLHRDTRHRAPSTFTMKTDGEAWLSAERRLIERDEWTPPSERETAARTAQTVLQYATAWIRERPLKETTREHYRVMLAEHVAPTLGPITLKNLSAPMVREWYSRTLTNRPTYRAHAYGLLHAICATAVEDELLEANPCRIKRATTTRPKRESVILSPTQVAELADRMDESQRALILILAWCGLRWGEAVELRRQDVTAGAESLSVSRAVVHRGGCTISTPKSGRSRSVVVPPHVRGDVKHHLDSYVGPNSKDLLFTPTRGAGCHLSDRTFRHRLHAVLSDMGVTGVTPHSMRHYAGTMATLSGATMPEVMSRLGHTTIGAAMRYQSLVDGRPGEVAEALSKLAQADAQGLH